MSRIMLVLLACLWSIAPAFADPRLVGHWLFADIEMRMVPGMEHLHLGEDGRFRVIMRAHPWDELMGCDQAGIRVDRCPVEKVALEGLLSFDVTAGTLAAREARYLNPPSFLAVHAPIWRGLLFKPGETWTYRLDNDLLVLANGVVTKKYVRVDEALPRQLHEGMLVLNEFDSVYFCVLVDYRDKPEALGLARTTLASAARLWQSEPYAAEDRASRALRAIKSKGSVWALLLNATVNLGAKRTAFEEILRRIAEEPASPKLAAELRLHGLTPQEALPAARYLAAAAGKPIAGLADLIADVKRCSEPRAPSPGFDKDRFRADLCGGRHGALLTLAETGAICRQ